jgi:N-acetylglucosamine-6-phosphate deacetylase
MGEISFLGDIVTPFNTIHNGLVTIENGKISYIGEVKQTECRVIDCGDNIIVPGFVDIHIHGAMRYDAMEPSIDTLDQISRFLAEGGVSGFLSTTYSTSHEELMKTLQGLEKVREHGTTGAQLFGVHLEGPYISQNKRGAQHPSEIRNPDINELEEILDRYGDLVKIVTMAPELDGAIEAIQFLKKRNIVVSAGHTDANYDETMTAIEAGLSHGSHLFNGMRSFHHREPGVVGALLTDTRVTVELIADGTHLHPAALMLTVKAKGVRDTVLVSDCIKPAGLPDGEYYVNDSKVVMNDGICKLLDGTLAGSIIRLNQAVQLMTKAGSTTSEAVQMASTNPTRILGLTQKGRLEKGFDADLVVMDREFNVKLTMVQGSIVYEA